MADRVGKMIAIIDGEANSAAAEIEQKGEEEFNAEVAKILKEQKAKVLETYAKKTKEVETRYAIAKSLAINRQRLEQIKARHAVMGKIHEDVRAKLVPKGGDKDLIVKLIVQGLL